MTRVCVTVDVESFYDGMAELGRPLPGANGIALRDTVNAVASVPSENRLTFFVVGKFARSCSAELIELAHEGHEIASHGRDHGRLPDDPDELERWLREGREMVEEVVQRPVVGFRPPRFDTPAGMSPEDFRRILGQTGFRYISSEHGSVDREAVTDLPVSRLCGVRIGGGSYQRLLPPATVTALLRRCPDPLVLYYHSYDFNPRVLPPLSSARSVLEVRELAARQRIPPVFRHVLDQFGSRTCGEVVDELRQVL